MSNLKQLLIEYLDKAGYETNIDDLEFQEQLSDDVLLKLEVWKKGDLPFDPDECTVTLTEDKLTIDVDENGQHNVFIYDDLNCNPLQLANQQQIEEFDLTKWVDLVFAEEIDCPIMQGHINVDDWQVTRKLILDNLETYFYHIHFFDVNGINSAGRRRLTMNGFESCSPFVKDSFIEFMLSFFHKITANDFYFVHQTKESSYDKIMNKIYILEKPNLTDPKSTTDSYLGLKLSIITPKQSS